MNPIICDEFTTTDPLGLKKRFKSGYVARYIETSDTELKLHKEYILNNKLCLSFTKSTRINIFYLVEHKDIDALETWIKEIRPQFPTLDIDLVKILKKDYDRIPLPSSTLGTDLFFNQDESGKNISMKLALSNVSHVIYTITNHYHAEYGNFYNLKFIIKMFLNYCIDKRIPINCKEDFDNLISLFCLNYLEDVINEFGKANDATVSLISDEKALFDGSYAVETHYIVDSSSVNYSNLHKYISDITLINYERFLGYINRNLVMKDYDTVFIKVLYSKKTYPLESYLATHLVRVGLSTELTSFREQYYRIKEALPDVYFWKRILYTQFGFQMFAYFWLTDSRVFRPFSEEEFMTVARKAGDNSSKYLFDNFAISLPAKNLENLSRLYSAGDFTRFVDALENPKSVSLKEGKKGKYKFLLILDKYEIFDEDPKNYFIKSDDFRVRKYSKSNFIAA